MMLERARLIALRRLRMRNDPGVRCEWSREVGVIRNLLHVRDQRHIVPIEQRERCFDHAALQPRVMGCAEGKSMAKRDGKRTRGAYFLGNLSQEHDADGRDPAPLQLRGDQAHGLIAHRSDRDEERRVDAVLDEQLRRLRCARLHEPPRRGDRAHE